MPPKKRKPWRHIKSKSTSGSASRSTSKPSIGDITVPPTSTVDSETLGIGSDSVINVDNVLLFPIPGPSKISTYGASDNTGYLEKSITDVSLLASIATTSPTLIKAEAVLDDSERYSSGNEIKVSLSSASGGLQSDQLSFIASDEHVASSYAGIGPIEPDLLKNACLTLSTFLHKTWICTVLNGGLNVFMLSRRAIAKVAIQRQLFFFPDGKVTLSVHCQELSTDFLGDVKSPGLLTEKTLNEFVDRCVKIVDHIRNFEICTGYDHDEFKHAWKFISAGEIDKNPYQESRYSETLRSINCTKLVPRYRFRCQQCKLLHGPVIRKGKSLATTEPHIKTPNVCLTEEQKLHKLEEQKKKLDSYSRRLDRMDPLKL